MKTDLPFLFSCRQPENLISTRATFTTYFQQQYLYKVSNSSGCLPFPAFSVGECPVNIAQPHSEALLCNLTSVSGSQLPDLPNTFKLFVSSKHRLKFIPLSNLTHSRQNDVLIGLSSLEVNQHETEPCTLLAFCRSHEINTLRCPMISPVNNAGYMDCTTINNAGYMDCTTMWNLGRYVFHFKKCTRHLFCCSVR